MDSQFLNLIRHILHEEGGKSDHPEDRGGKTNFGVTQHFYNHVLGDVEFCTDILSAQMQVALPDDVFSITPELARVIYWHYFWKLPKIDQLPEWLALGVMDFGVNSGPETAIRLLQSSINAVHGSGKIIVPDARIGPKTCRYASECDQLNLVEEYHAVRLNHIAKNPTYATFGGGWNRRITRIESKCVQLAMINGVTHHV